MTPDEQHTIYMEAIKEAQKHNTPSRDTKEFMKETRDNFKDISDSLKSLEFHIIEIKNDLKITKTQTLKTNGRVNKLDEYKPMLKAIREERKINKEIKVDMKKDFYKKLFDILWKVGIVILLALLNLNKLKDFL